MFSFTFIPHSNSISISCLLMTRICFTRLRNMNLSNSCRILPLVSKSTTASSRYSAICTRPCSRLMDSLLKVSSSIFNFSLFTMALYSCSVISPRNFLDSSSATFSWHSSISPVNVPIVSSHESVISTIMVAWTCSKPFSLLTHRHAR